MAEEREELKDSVKEIPALVKGFKKLGETIESYFSGKQKFSEIKIGEKTFTYSGDFSIGAEIKDCPDGEYETEFGKATVKDGKVIDLKKEEPAVIESPAEMKAEFVKKFSEQKEAFEKLLNGFKEAFDKKIEALETNATKKDEILKNMFELIQKMSESPSMESTFKKKDGEPAAPQNGTAFERAKKEAALISKKIFN